MTVAAICAAAILCTVLLLRWRLDISFGASLSLTLMLLGVSYLLTSLH